MPNPTLNILVCTHQDSYIYGSEILRPIIVGAANIECSAAGRVSALQTSIESTISHSNQACKRGGGGTLHYLLQPLV